jgi:glycogen debranching enzyme
MWHEISQSAAYVDWFHRYPYAYRHTDITPAYLVAMGNIWRSSGDRALLEASWPSLQVAWRFCLAHLDPHDGLLVIPPEQSGVNENEADRTEKELPLELVWAAGADAFAELAEVEGQPALSHEAREASDRARAALAEFWDPTRNYYFEGLRADGKPLSQEMTSPIWGVWQNLFPSRERELVLDRLDAPAFRTAWGLHSLPSDDPRYQPDSYQHGSVWPVATGTYILATLAAHRPREAWPMWQALVRQSFLDAPGHVPEALSGAAPRLLDVSVPEQTWSSAALLTSTVRGILGLDPDTPNDTLRFEPHLPPEWTKVVVNNYRLGERRLSFTLQRRKNEIDLSVVNDGAPFDLAFAPMIPVKRFVRAYADGKQIPVRLSPEEHDVHARVSLTVKRSAVVRLTELPSGSAAQNR